MYDPERPGWLTTSSTGMLRTARPSCRTPPGRTPTWTSARLVRSVVWCAHIEVHALNTDDERTFLAAKDKLAPIVTDIHFKHCKYNIHIDIQPTTFSPKQVLAHGCSRTSLAWFCDLSYAKTHSRTPAARKQWAPRSSTPRWECSRGSRPSSRATCHSSP